MAGNFPYLQQGPASFEVNVTVTGGQLVEPDSTTQKVKPATAGTGKCLGVAVIDGAPTGSGSNLAFGTNRPLISVARSCVAYVTYAADAAFGAKLKCAAAGAVTPWVSGTDAADLIVGQCFEKSGVTASATLKRAWIF